MVEHIIIILLLALTVNMLSAKTVLVVGGGEVTWGKNLRRAA